MAGCINCFNKCFDNSFFKWVMASCCVEFIKRIIPLLQSIWMHGDFTLDVLQTFTYYEHAFENGTYSEWALNRTKTTNATLETVHPGYFYTSVVAWVLPPFLMSCFFLLESCSRIQPFLEHKLSFWRILFHSNSTSFQIEDIKHYCVFGALPFGSNC